MDAKNIEILEGMTEMKVIDKIPFVKFFTKKLNQWNYKLEQESTLTAIEVIKNRIKLKTINHEKINIIFVCHRPSIWNSLKTVYESLKEDEIFNVMIVTIPNKKQLPGTGLSGNIYESEGAEDFWKGENVISGYNYETKTWLDLRVLKPDYICFQQPYNICRTDTEKSWVISKYAKLFYIPYGADTIGNGVYEDTRPMDFMINLSFYFAIDKYDDEKIKNWFSEKNNYITHVHIGGFPRYDDIQKYKNCNSEIWKFHRNKNKFRIIWTPRWCTNEGNCSFFDYKDKFFEYCDKNMDVDFIFRPHPQAFQNWVATGMFTELEAEKYKDKFSKKENMTIDYEKDYMKQFYSSDCMITDPTSLVAEYFLTGKPIIYCHKKDCWNEWSRKLSEGFYWVNNWTELKQIIDNLKSGTDPLKDKRIQLMKELFFLPEGGSGKKIAQIIKNDVLGEL